MRSGTVSRLDPVRLDPEGLRRCITRAGEPERVYLFEHGVDMGIVRSYAEMFDLCSCRENAKWLEELQMKIAVSRFMGHELVRIDLPGSTPFSVKGRGGGWEEVGRGAVETWADLDALKWARPEDVITPVAEAKRLWGERISLLGGLDVDLVARADEQTIRHKVRETLECCQPGGGYCLGLGNWVTSYIPPENYLCVLDEARRFHA